MEHEVTKSPAAATAERGHRKIRIGQVVSDKMNKTIIVRVERRLPHPRYRKIVSNFRKFFAHDEKQEARIGDTVRIQETRPMSKNKTWRLVEIIHRPVDRKAS